MRTAGKKRANSARRRPADLNSVLMALTLVLGVSGDQGNLRAWGPMQRRGESLD